MFARFMIVGTLLVSAFVGSLAIVRRELRVREDRDTRPCPECRALAYTGGAAFVDEQGHRLRFATPELAAKYATDYARP